MIAEKPSLYRRMLDEQYDQLPAALADFHRESITMHARGVFDVKRGRGWLRRLAATVAGLPPEGPAIPLELTVEPVGDGERWTRRFGRHVLGSLQTCPRPHVMLERIGLLTFRYRATVENRRMVLAFERATCCGIPVPRWLGPRVSGWSEGDDQRWIVDIRVEVPLLGMLSHYHGEVRPCRPTASVLRL